MTTKTKIEKAEKLVARAAIEWLQTLVYDSQGVDHMEAKDKLVERTAVLRDLLARKDDYHGTKEQ